MNISFRRYASAFTISTLALGLGTTCFAAVPSRVFTETNGATGNAVLVYTRAADGSLTLSQTVPTLQKGTGGFLEEQGAVLAISHYLLAINAGSNSISVLNIGGPTVRVIGNYGSGGVLPKSLTVYKNIVYVLNQGNSGNITGFTFDTTTGVLTPIPGSTQPLSGIPGGQPAQVGFTNNGVSLVVTEKISNVFEVYAVNANGVAGPPTVYSSNAPNPYGFASGKNSRVYITEANGAVDFGSSVSSYTISPQHIPQVITASAGTGQSAACWAILNVANTFLYVTNNESNTISVFSVDTSGHLTLDPTFTVTTPSQPYDIAISADGLNVYVLYLGPAEIVTYTVNADGSLTAGPAAAVSSTVAAGLVVH